MSNVETSLLPGAAEALEALRSLSEWAEDIDVAVAWASSGRGRGPHWAALDLSKVRRALVGTHFFQTEPRALAELRSHGVLRVISDPTGVFHPKVVVGRAGDRVRALIGSSNLTTGGYALNTEIGVSLEGPVSAPPLALLSETLDALWSRPDAIVPDDAWMDWYRNRHAKRPRPRPSAGPLPGHRRPTSRVLELSWSEYFGELLGHEGRESVHGGTVKVFPRKASYRSEVRACRKAFARNQRFADMPDRDRALVSGYGGGTTGYLGHMGTAMQFRKLVKNRPEEVGAVLDRLPLDGDLDSKTIDEVVRGLFAVTGVGLPSGTRLLSAKRPDYFFPANDANIARIDELIGSIRPSARRSADDYLALLEQVRQAPWWRAPEPDDRAQRRTWRARAALLDVLLYTK